MMRKDNTQLYPLRTSIGVMKGSPVRFIPSGSDSLIDANNAVFQTFEIDVYYDRRHRGKSWFILDLAIDSERRVPYYPEA